MSTTLLISAITAAAIVQGDGVSLRAAARDSADQHATLTQGDLLEIRGQRLDYLKVYDHRRERAGYVKATSVRTIELDQTQVAHFLSVVRFLRDSVGQESLGISYAQSFIKVSPGLGKDPDYPEVIDALGRMAERLAARASKGQTKDRTAQQIEGVGFLGVKMMSVDRDGLQSLCYDGASQRELLGQAAGVVALSYQLNAALTLTKPQCIDSRLTAIQRKDLDLLRLKTIEQVEAITQATAPKQIALTAIEKNKLYQRKASILASLSFSAKRSLQSDTKQVAIYAAQAIETLAKVDKGELSDNDKADFEETALRVGAIRMAAAQAAPMPKNVSFSQGELGQTCIVIDEAAKRCTYGVVWAQSLSIAPNAKMMTIAVQPSETWRELWLMRQVDNNWVFDVLPPSTDLPQQTTLQLGVAEFAGWVPADTKQEARILVARDVLEKTKVRTSFEVLKASSLSTESRASHPQTLFAFAKFQQAVWRGSTLTVR